MSNRPWWNLEPCGTPAAYRRHLRHGEPVDQRCRDAEQLRWEQRGMPRRWDPERYAALQAAGMSRAEAARLSRRRAA